MGSQVAKRDVKSVELDHRSETYLLYREKLSRFEELKAEVEKLRASLEEEIGDAEVALIMDEPVITYQYINKLKTGELKKDNETLYNQFVVQKVVDVFDPDLFKAKHPNLYRRYQSRVFRVVDK